MISWIQKYCQRHIRVVFFLVLIAVGLPMIVIYSSSGSGSGGGGTKVLERPFFGVNLANQEQARRVFADGELSAYLRAGYAALQGGQLQQYSLQRVAGLAVADELHLPAYTIDSPQVKAYILTLRAFQNQEGQFDQSAYTRFADSLKAGGPFTTADVNRVLRDDVRLEALTKIVGGPGYVLPPEVKMQLSRLDSSWTVQVASLDYASFSPAINPTEETLRKFHEEYSFRYDVPARPRLSYLEFKAADFAPPVAPTEAELRGFYNTNIASFPVPAEAAKPDAALPATAVDNFPKVRDQVEAALRNLASRRIASQAANELTVALYERKLAANSPELAAFLTSQGRAPVGLAPFAPDQPTADKPWLANYAEAISRLSRERFFSDPLATPDGIIVLLWQESLPAYKPFYSDVRDRVASDYRETEKRRLFIERGNALKAQLQAAAKTPAGFAAQAAAEKFEVKSYANFTLRQPPQDLPQPALATLARLETGQVSDLVGLGDKGLLVYAQEKKLPDLTAANPRYAEVQGQLMAFIASNNENSYLGELVELELKKTTPVDAP